MTDQEINVRLAKWAGWRFQQGVEPSYGGGPQPATGWFDPRGEFHRGKRSTLDYTSSLDAIAGLEAKLSDEQCRSYAQQLVIALGLRKVTRNGWLVGGSDLCAEEWVRCVKATARQKVLALVRALGLEGV